MDTNGTEPELSGLREQTGYEPELSNARPKCAECGRTMQKNLAGAWMCMPCMRDKHRLSSVKPTRARLDRDPGWFNAGSKSVGEQQIRHVRAGLHPMGDGLLNDEGKTCGNCLYCYAHRVGSTYYKCTVSRMTHGPSTDVRVSWPACVKWQPRLEEKGR